MTFHTLVVFAVLAVSRAQDAATATAGSGSGASAEAKLDFTIGVSNSATSNAVTFGNVANTFGNTFAGNANAVATSSTNLGTSNFVVGSTIGGTTSNSGKGGKGDAGAMALFGGGGAIKGGDGGGKGGKTDGKGGKGDGQLFKASGNEIDSKGGKGGKGKKGGASVGAMKQGTTHWSTFYSMDGVEIAGLSIVGLVGAGVLSVVLKRRRARTMEYTDLETVDIDDSEYSISQI